METRRATAAEFVNFNLSAAALAEEPRHLQLARNFLGTKETSGKRDNPVIMQFYADVGHDYVEHDEVAWCAAFLGAMFERCGVRSTRALNARSYLKWGEAVDPEFGRPGDVAIFTRGKNTWQGHVAFVLRVADKFVEVLGGNQNNSVSIARYPRERLLGIRRVGKYSVKASGLKFGDRGRRVEALQQQLTDLGYAVGHVDGTFGSRTREAQLAFEADNDLQTDGIASEADMGVMEKAKKREISEARKNATLTSLAGRSTIANAAVHNISAGSILSGAGVVGILGEFSGTLGVVGDALQIVKGFVADNGFLIGAAVIGVGAWIAWQAWKSGDARVQGERAGRIM
ncbi:TIGR02594 family protein [Taklimakanibacter albus]|uniref:TIGR02594 family protein n=1 Tax=Taklimakanibacter albus TaxID=2800327 RepID=A0ACC5R6M2_9HYPH|nr:TIGR02594 family protein [Aestuariivirga sp. YIM B02566]MBK1868272.1 TIGR02594 family protein [Aestuariivirga sp. YIM B02566]